jgi:hypothetical protein
MPGIEEHQISLRFNQSLEELMGGKICMTENLITPVFLIPFLTKFSFLDLSDS